MIKCLYLIFSLNNSAFHVKYRSCNLYTGNILFNTPLGGLYGKMKGEIRMNRQKLSQQVMWTSLITLLLGATGCGAPAATPKPTSTPIPETVAEFEVTYDGNECTVSGPSESLTGRHLFFLNDLSDKEVYLWVGRLLEGKTVQDLLDEQGEPGMWWPKPSWFFYTDGSSWINENGRKVWKYMLNEEGEHVIYVGVYLPDTKNLWFCAQTFVIEAPSE